ncbi:MAG: nodulation protein NfeD [Verrucomicrobia bacterium]|jgi:membrane-bound serine protease (ClpP class)|nr:nodulation protein NfeD [Verrucomicrobiota bacterium]
MRRWIFIVAAMLTCAAADAAQVGLIKIDGAIGPATASFISRAIDLSGERKDECLIIQLDTPGGLLDSTKVIVQKFLAASVPIVVYVGPPGAHAGSAGCFITIAADVAAMAPTTSIGAAHPVSIGGNPTGGEEKADDTMKQKLENFATSYIETIAAKRNRNVEWAKSSVKESAAISSEKALDINVIDLIANDLPDLLKQLDGREVNDRALKTAGATIVEIPMVAREKVFQLLWRPEVMFLLMLMAIYGIIGELSNPGAILPGVVGGIALILALYMAAILPVNIAGLALIGLAMLLFIADIYATTHGVLTAGGIISFLLGALMLFNRAEPGFRLSLAYIIPGVVVTAAFFIFIVGAGLRAQLLPVRVGLETMPGKTVNAISRIDASGGKVFVEGEYWNAVSDAPIESGQPVEIIAVTGLTLKVKPKSN